MARLDRLSDIDLAAAANRGDRRALEVLLNRHADRILSICGRILNHPHDARDAAQEAMIAVIRGLDRFDGRSQFTTWLYRVTTNAALDEVRRRKRRPLPIEHIPERGSQHLRSSDSKSLEASVTDQIVVADALALLPPEYRAAVALRDLLGCDYAEIAAILEIPIGTVRSRIARGRAALATSLATHPSTSAHSNDDSWNQPTNPDHQSS